MCKAMAFLSFLIDKSVASASGPFCFSNIWSYVGSTRQLELKKGCENENRADRSQLKTLRVAGTSRTGVLASVTLTTFYVSTCYVVRYCQRTEIQASLPLLHAPRQQAAGGYHGRRASPGPRARARAPAASTRPLSCPPPPTKTTFCVRFRGRHTMVCKGQC